MSTGPTINATSTVPLIITPGDLPPATTLPSQTPPSSKESPSPLPSISTGAIVGIAVGAVVILMVLGLLCICCKKKKRRRDEERCAREQSDRERSQHQSRQLSQRTEAKQKKVQGPKPKNGTEAKQKKVQGPKPKNDSKSPSPAPNQSRQPPDVVPPKISSGQLSHAAPPTLSAPPLVSSCGGSGSKNSGSKLPPPASLGTRLKSETNKGIYPNGDEIVVKQLKTGSVQGEREFQAEVDIISLLLLNIRKKHVVEKSFITQAAILTGNQIKGKRCL